MTETKTVCNNKFYVFTGGPCTGKTTLLKEMEKQNFGCVQEVIRDIIKRQAEKNLDSREWRRSEEFRELILARSVQVYEFANKDNSGTTFFDRSIIDSGPYPRIHHSPFAKKFDSAAKQYRYNKRVFIFPPWEEIYQKDKERIQDFNEALFAYKATLVLYAEYGYELIEVPKINIKERIKFILSNLS